jgi:hypothetical protein
MADSTPLEPAPRATSAGPEPKIRGNTIVDRDKNCADGNRDENY